MLTDLLQGKPLGHPLHPLLVHLPIGLLYLTVLLDIVALFFDGGNVLVRAAFYCLLVGFISALLAAVPGLADRADIRDDHPARKTANTHMALNIAAVGLTAFSLILRYGSLDAPSTPISPFLLSLVAVAFVSYSGYLGGILVYGDGIGAGRHRRHTETPELTIRPSTTAAPGDSVAVAEASRLAEGGTLRAEVDGVVIAIARIEGRLYAFQEFCTHRFGPLSEGHFEGHNVVCPWHNSCFDVRSGKVTQGPAKVDLKTLEVVEQDGWIHVTPYSAQISAPAGSET